MYVAFSTLWPFIEILPLYQFKDEESLQNEKPECKSPN